MLARNSHCVSATPEVGGRLHSKLSRSGLRKIREGVETASLKLRLDKAESVVKSGRAFGREGIKGPKKVMPLDKAEKWLNDRTVFLGRSESDDS